MYNSLLEKTFYGNTVLDYLIFVAVLVIGFIVVRIFKSVVTAALKRITIGTKNTLDDFLVHLFERSLMPLLYYGVFYVSFRSLSLPQVFDRIIYIIGVVLLTFIVIRFITTVIQHLIENHWLKGAEESDKRSFRGLLPAMKVVIWGLGLIFLLDNLGFEISTVIAGLGIGGIAVAMASQAVLGDLFSYFAILTDRPFEVGDFIIVGDMMGTVEHVGIKTTRVRSLGGEQLVFSNTDLTSSRIRNYKRMERRRVLFALGVTYETGLERLKEIPDIIKEAITSTGGTDFARAHFSSYGDFSLNFEIVYNVLTGDYAKYMDIQQEINLKIKEEFEKRAIEFAYPTQLLYHAKPGGGEVSVPD